MKLSLSILLFVSALVSVQASTNPKVSPEGCIRPNNRGEGQGLGWKGYCCKTSDDCHDTCIKGKCNGPVNPKLAPSIDDDSSSGKKGSNKLCIRLNNRGDGNGLGWNGYCCKTSDDCRDTCIKGKCNGKANPKYAEPIDKDDNSKVCTRPNNRGEGKGLGWNGYCCKTSDDCRDTCIKGKCNGKANPKYAEPIDEDDNSKVCTRPNNRGEGKGLGWNGYCCKTSDDCRDTCIKGKCNGKANPKYAQPIDDDDSN